MTKQITLVEALELVSFEQDEQGYWRVFAVDGNIYGNVWGNVFGGVFGTIKGRRWEFISETPKEKL